MIVDKNKITPSNYITLNEEQLKLFNLLKSKSGDSPDHWSSINDITKELDIKSHHAKKVLESLKDTPGMILITETNTKDSTPRYGLAPQMLEKIIIGEHFDNKKNVYSALYIAEPAFGTKAFDDEYTMKGLALFLKANGYADNIRNVIIQGGVIPHIPPYASTSYVNDLKFLGQIPRTDKTKGFSESWLEKKIDNEYEDTFYKKYINNKDKKKISDLSDAFQAAKIQIQTLMNVLPESTLLRIQSGEEDRKNIKHLEESYIQQWSKEKEEQIKQMKRETYERIEKLNYNNFINNIKKDMLGRTLHNTKIMRKPDEHKDEYYERLEDIVRETADNALEGVSFNLNKFAYKQIEEKYERNDAKIIKQVEKFLWDKIKPDNHPKDAAKESIEKIENISAKNNKLIVDYNAKLEFLNDAARWTDQLIGESLRAAVTWFTRQYPVFAPEVELAFKKAKDHYSKHFFNLGIKQQMTFHVSPRKTTTINTGVINDVLTKEKDEAVIDYDTDDVNSKTLMMIHNINSSFSDNTSSTQIKEAKLESNYRNMVLKKFYDEVRPEISPDIVLLGGHGLGGFRAVPWFKHTEDFIKGEFIKGQEISYLITLPTLQSEEKLEWLKGKIINHHVKRFTKGPYASGVVLHTEDSEGVNKLTVIDNAKLIEFGKLAAEIDVYDKYINDEKVSKDVKKQLMDIVAEKKKKIEASGDYHLITSSDINRHAIEEMIKASQIYQRSHGLPDILSLDEILHGAEERKFASGARYNGLIPEQFLQEVLMPILNDKTLTGDDKAYKIARAALRNQRGITVHNVSEQKHAYKLLVKPYVDQVLANGGQAALTSGNHNNKSQPLSDEAIELGNQHEEKYIRDNKLHILDGKGNDIGLGTIRLENGGKLFIQHRFNRGNDEGYGMMSHTKKMNNDADIVIGGDGHQDVAWYANRQFGVEHPGMEPGNKFCSLVGLQPGVRGFNNIYYDTKHRGIYSVEFVLNPTLEKIIEKEPIL